MAPRALCGGLMIRYPESFSKTKRGGEFQPEVVRPLAATRSSALPEGLAKSARRDAEAPGASCAAVSPVIQTRVAEDFAHAADCGFGGG
jgi:hypothetical protein